MVRGAFTLIELIIVIVIIGIIALPTATMLQTNTKGLEESLTQEAIFILATQLQQASTFRWDSVSKPSNDESSKILDTANGAAGNQRLSGNIIPVGGIESDMHRRFYDGLSTPGSANSQLGGFTPSVTTGGTSTAKLQGYKRSGVTFSTNVLYVSDNNATSPFPFPTTGSATVSTNLKMIELSISDGSNLLSTLRVYTANIGEAPYASRRFY